MVGLGSSLGSSDMSLQSCALLNSPSIPRHLTRVPKDQHALLERPDAWFTSLKESPHGTTNVPPKVLEHLKYLQTSRTLPPPAQKQRQPVSNGPSPTAQAKQADPADNESDEGTRSDALSDAVSWPISPEPPSRLANKIRSPASIKSQVEVQETAPAATISRSAPADTPNSPQSSPIRPAPKRLNPSSRFLQSEPKRRRFDEPPSSSAGLEDELETAIPGALGQGTPPINRIAARLMTVPEAVTSPPCGQGSLAPSTYTEARSSGTPSVLNERRIMKKINFGSPGETTANHSRHKADVQLPTIPCSQAEENPLPLSSRIQPASTLDLPTDVRLSRLPQVVQDTPSVSKTLNTGQRNDNDLQPSPPPAGSLHPDLNPTVINRHSKRPGGNFARVEVSPPKNNIAREELVAFLDSEWDADNSDWLPQKLQHLKASLSVGSLQTLCELTETAVKAGTRPSRLWAEPDGYLYRAALNQPERKLSFRKNLIDEASDIFGCAIRQSPKGGGNGPRVTSALSEKPVFVEDNRRNSVATEAAVKNFESYPFEVFCNEYPSFAKRHVGDFVRACMALNRCREKKLLPRWLYDDFIRAFVDGYISYVEHHDEDSDRVLTAVQWYVDTVDEPVFQKGLVTPFNLDRVFKVYPDEAKSAREVASQEPAPPLIARHEPALKILDTPLKEGHILPPQLFDELPENHKKPAADSAISPAHQSNPQPMRSPDEIQPIPDTRGATTNERRISLEQKNGDVSRGDANANATPANRSKGKQRETDLLTPRNRNMVPSSTTVQRRTENAPNDDDVVFVSSNQRPHSAQSDTARPEKSIKREGGAGHLSDVPVPQATPHQLSASEQKDSTSSQRRRVGTVAETPPPPAIPTSSRGSVSRPGKPSLLEAFGPPSRPLKESPAGSAVSTSTSAQSNRVKKMQKEKKTNEAWLAKLDKLRRKGALGPRSSVAPQDS